MVKITELEVARGKLTEQMRGQESHRGAWARNQRETRWRCASKKRDEDRFSLSGDSEVEVRLEWPERKGADL